MMKTRANQPVFRTACARAVVLLCGLSLLAPAPLWAQPSQQPPQPNDIGSRSNRDQVVLNFVNADIEAVTRAIGVMLDRQIIIDPRVKGTITVYSEQPVSVAEAYRNLAREILLRDARP